MERFNINGYEITIYEGYYGDDLFINKDGERFYSCRVHRGDGMNRAMEVIQ